MQVDTATWDAIEGWSPTVPSPDGRPCLVLVVGPPAAAPDAALAAAVAEVEREFQGHAVVGCSSPQRMLACRIREERLVVLVVRFDRGDVRAAHVDVAAAGGARRAARQLAADLDHPELQAVLLLSGALHLNATELATGIGDVLPAVPVVGALAGTGAAGDGSWTLVDGVARPGWASAVGVLGRDVRVGLAHASGWTASGVERLVTRSHGNVVHRVDDDPAAAALGHRASTVVAVRDLDGRTAIRSGAGTVRGDAVRFGGDVPQGAVVQTATATADDLLQAAELAAKGAATGSEEVALVLTGRLRGGILAGRADEELERVAAALRPGTPLVAVRSTSEIASADGRTEVHDHSVAVVTLAEPSAPAR